MRTYETACTCRSGIHFSSGPQFLSIGSCKYVGKILESTIQELRNKMMKKIRNPDKSNLESSRLKIKNFEAAAKHCLLIEWILGPNIAYFTSIDAQEGLLVFRTLSDYSSFQYGALDVAEMQPHVEHALILRPEPSFSSHQPYPPS